MMRNFCRTLTEFLFTQVKMAKYANAFIFLCMHIVKKFMERFRDKDLLINSPIIGKGPSVKDVPSK